MTNFADICIKIKKYNEDHNKHKKIDDNLVIDAISSYKYIVGMNFINEHLRELKTIVSYIKEAFKNKGSVHYLNDTMIQDYPVRHLFENYFLQYFNDDNLKFDFFNLSLFLIKDILNDKYSNFYNNKETQSEYVNTLLSRTTPYSNFNITDVTKVLEQSSDPEFFVSSYMTFIVAERDKSLVRNITDNNLNLDYILQFIKKDSSSDSAIYRNKNVFLFNTINQQNKKIIPDTPIYETLNSYFSTISEENKDKFTSYYKAEFEDIFFYSSHVLNPNGQDDFKNYEDAFINFLNISNYTDNQQIDILKSLFDSFSKNDLDTLRSRTLYNYYIHSQINIEKEAINKHITQNDENEFGQNKKRL